VDYIQQLAKVMVQLGDLQKSAADLSNLFVQCMSRLSVQTPSISTVLALISRDDHDFGSLVARKMGDALLSALHDGMCRCLFMVRLPIVL
jgi:predicted negative regulator of RcsB-dependent stress response